MTNWVFLRGLGREHRHWQQFINKFKTDKCVGLDLPGTGEHLNADTPWTISKNVEFAQSKTQDLKGPINLVAISFGAMVALGWASLDSRINKVFLINSSSSLSPFYERLKPENYKALLQGLLFKSLPQREEMILNMVSNLNPVPDETLQDWISIQETATVPIVSLIKQLVAASRFQPPPKLSCDGLILSSKNDRFVDCKCSERLAEYLAWPLHSHPSAGHDLPLDDPAWLINRIKNSQ